MSVIKDIVLGLAKPITDLVDDLHTSDEEKGAIKAKLFELQVGLYEKVMEYEAKLAEFQTKIITAETASESWMTRNWRPLMMVIFTALVVNRWTGLSAILGFPSVFISQEIEMELWSVIKIGIGGYVGGRSLEKIVPPVVEALKNRKE